MEEDGSELPPWSVDRTDFFSMWRSITHTLISTGHVAELYQELDYASQTGREDLNSNNHWAIESYYNSALFSNKLLQITTNSTENNKSIYRYNKKSINGDTIISSLGESNIDDDNLCNILSNFIAEAADLLYHRNPLPNFENIFAQEELFLSSDGLDDVTLSISKSSTAATPCQYIYTPTLSPSPSFFNSDQE